jgi:hypothetical protein
METRVPFQLLPLSLWRFLQLTGESVFVVDAAGHRQFSWRRVLVMLAFLPLFAMVQLTHWLGFLLDELLFPGYRKVTINRPVFVLGVPRSGTTFLHRVLARDIQFTTFTTWECLLAPSVSQRKFWLGVAALDRCLGAPLARLWRRVETYALRGLEGVHQVRLDAAEEDYLTLLPILRCFILVLPFPLGKEIWRIGRFDHDVSLVERKQVMAYYRACLQKHLYVHGTNKTLLSKNASFASLAGSLAEQFTDARIIVCMRQPLETLPSQLSAIAAGIRLFMSNPGGDFYRRQMVSLFPYYYDNLLNALPRQAPGRHVFVNMEDLQADLAAQIEAAYTQLRIPMQDAFRTALIEEDTKARAYMPCHHYSLVSLGLDETKMQQRFAVIYARYDFASRGNESKQITVEGPGFAQQQNGTYAE